uniref:Uncharacterized protein n=1 Tax=Sphaerodactylus townsendi TaxID=933632 RepID=A0ACB8EF91_9SAUR
MEDACRQQMGPLWGRGARSGIPVVSNGTGLQPDRLSLPNPALPGWGRLHLLGSHHGSLPAAPERIGSLA